MDTTIIDKYGWPGAIAIVMAFVLWTLGKWFKIWADRFLDRGIQHIDLTDRCLKTNSEMQEKLLTTQQEIVKNHAITAENTASILAHVKGFECKFSPAFKCEFKGDKQA